MVKFTDFELDIINYAVDYLLDAELLEEDGWTKKDIKALNTIHEKIKKDKMAKVPDVCRTCPFVDYCDDKENCKHRKELENRE